MPFKINLATNNELHIRNKFTLLTFISSVFVIFIHANNIAMLETSEKAIGFGKAVFSIETYWAKLIDNSVPLFFFISGILFFRTFEIKKLFSKWKTRVFSIALPYLIWCTIYYLYYVICTNVPLISSLMSESNTVNFSIIEWIRWLWVDRYYTLWFLQNLMIYIALAPIIWLLLKDHFSKIPTGLVILLLYIVGKKYLPFDIPYSADFEFYLIGSYIGLNGRKWLYYSNKTLSIVSCVYIALILISAFRFWNIAFSVLFFFAIWFAIDLLPINNRQFPWWMSITFFTYVAHDIFLEAFEKVFFKVFGASPITALLDYIFMPLIIEALLIAIAFVLRKWLPIIWKLLSGNRAMVK